MAFDSGSQAAETLYREAIARSPHREARARTCFNLARFLKEQADCIPQLRTPVDGHDLYGQFVKRWGKANVSRLKDLDPEPLRAAGVGEAVGVDAGLDVAVAAFERLGFERKRRRQPEELEVVLQPARR